MRKCYIVYRTLAIDNTLCRVHNYVKKKKQNANTKRKKKNNLKLDNKSCTKHSGNIPGDICRVRFTPEAREELTLVKAERMEVNGDAIVPSPSGPEAANQTSALCVGRSKAPINKHKQKKNSPLLVSLIIKCKINPGVCG